MPGDIRSCAPEKSRRTTNTIVQQIMVQPGGFTGWHSHLYVTYLDVPASVTSAFIPAPNPGDRDF